MTFPRSPRVSVIMAAYNAERHLREALDSILGQTLRDFELIIVDDASTDRTPEILADYARRDARIRLLRNEINLGPSPTGNRGLEVARAPIIARMDADDISALERLELQVAFLDAHPDHILVGSGHRVIDEHGQTRYVKFNPMNNFAVQWQTRLRMPMMHSSVCFRARMPDRAPVRYDESFPVGEDYSLISHLLTLGKAAVLSPVLIDYRTHTSNLSTTRKLELRINTKRTSLRTLRNHLPPHLADSFAELLDCLALREPATPGMVRKSIRAFDAMLVRDIAMNPSAKVWLRRQSAGILAEAILRNGKGFGSLRVTAAFIVHARHYLWPLALRVLENKGYLPRWLQSYPDPEG